MPHPDDPEFVSEVILVSSTEGTDCSSSDSCAGCSDCNYLEDNMFVAPLVPRVVLPPVVPFRTDPERPSHEACILDRLSARKSLQQSLELQLQELPERQRPLHWSADIVLDGKCWLLPVNMRQELT